MGRRLRELNVEMTRGEARAFLRVIGYALLSGDLSFQQASSFSKIYTRLNDELWKLEGIAVEVTQNDAAAIDRATENE